MALLLQEQRILMESMVGDDQVLDDQGQAALMRLAQSSAVNSPAMLHKSVALLQDVHTKGLYGGSLMTRYSLMEGTPMAAGPASADMTVSADMTLSAYPPVVPHANDIANDIVWTSEHLASLPSRTSCTALNVRISRLSLCVRRVCVRVLNGLGAGLGDG